MSKIKKHPVLEVPVRDKVIFKYNGQEVEGEKGYTIAAALHRAGFPVHSHSLDGRERSLECGIGKCGAYFFGAEILTIYTKEPDVVACGVEILSITTVPYFLCGIMDLFPGALRGMGYSSVPMILSVIGTVGMRILWIFAFFPYRRSLYFLFISYPASWLATIVMQVICYYFVRKKCLGKAVKKDL